jgi:hypothetical protein
VACEDNALLLHAYSDGELDLVRSLEIEARRISTIVRRRPYGRELSRMRVECLLGQASRAELWRHPCEPRHGARCSNGLRWPRRF